MKTYMADEDGFNGIGSLFASAMIAGINILTSGNLYATINCCVSLSDAYVVPRVHYVKNERVSNRRAFVFSGSADHMF